MVRFEEFQRLLLMAEPAALSLNAQAAMGVERPPRRSQFSLLMRHFLERFFNHETASPDGDAKSRLVLLAVATGLPGFIVTLYLWPVYHPILGWPLDKPLDAGPPPYWLQVNHHFFFVIFSFVAMGIITVFEWDLFFPDLLDVFVLTTLPIQNRKLFLARVAAIAIFIVGFLLDANLLALPVIPSTFEPTNIWRFLGGHLAAVLGAGLFSAAFVLALQGVLLSVLGERLFRRVSLLLQGLSISALLMLLLLFPVLSGGVPAFLQSGKSWIFFCPPFWFLGVYQRVLEGPSAPSVFARLAETGFIAMLLTMAVAALAYPLALLRRVRQLVLGSGTRDTRSWAAGPAHRLLHATLLRTPAARAVFHFISQTLLRVQRYRIYLVLYGGVGLSVLVASVLRLVVAHGRVSVEISADGVRAAVAIVAFWTIAGLRMAFVSPGNRQGSWAFRIVDGRPPTVATALEQSRAAELWTMLWAGIATLSTLLILRLVAPPELRTGAAGASLLLIGEGCCLLLADVLFLNVKSVAFTGEPAREQPSLALTLLKYFTFLPLIAWAPVVAEPWIEARLWHFVAAVVAIAGAHWALRRRRLHILEEHCSMPALEDDEEDFPMKLGLRY